MLVCVAHSAIADGELGGTMFSADVLFVGFRHVLILGKVVRKVSAGAQHATKKGT